MRFAITYDQLHPLSNAFFELAVRRLVQIQLAVIRNPKHPAFEGLDVVVSAVLDSSGGVALQEFSTRVSESMDQRTTEAKKLKAERQYREETGKEESRFNKESTTIGFREWRRTTRCQVETKRPSQGSGMAS